MLADFCRMTPVLGELDGSPLCEYALVLASRWKEDFLSYGTQLHRVYPRPAHGHRDHLWAVIGPSYSMVHAGDFGVTVLQPMYYGVLLVTSIPFAFLNILQPEILQP